MIIHALIAEERSFFSVASDKETLEFHVHLDDFTSCISLALLDVSCLNGVISNEVDPTSKFGMSTGWFEIRS